MSKLPGDVKKCKEAAEEVICTLDLDFREQKVERILPYSHKTFCRAAIEWIVATDQVSNTIILAIILIDIIPISSQPIQALEHAKFKEMIDITSRATNGVQIPGQKITQGEIIRLFKDHITKLKTQLNVSILKLLRLKPYYFLFALQGPTVQGEVSLTCDAWQASNTNGYFVVTAHWIEEATSAKWELKNALIDFMRLNNSHNSEQLGQALFKVIIRVRIGHKVSCSYEYYKQPTLFIICCICKGWPYHM